MFCRAGDAEYAWKKMGMHLDKQQPGWVLYFGTDCFAIYSDGLRIDGKKWKVEYAIKADFKYFGWKWTESRSPSRSPSRFEDALRTLAAMQVTCSHCPSCLLQVTLSG